MFLVEKKKKIVFCSWNKSYIVFHGVVLTPDKFQEKTQSNKNWI